MSADPIAAGEALVCAVSVTPRPDRGRNEDAAVSVRAPRAGARGVIVADGLGSYAQAGAAARYAADRAASWLRDEADHVGGATFARLFARVHTDLRAHARELAGGDDPPEQTHGTTLLVGLDAGAELLAAYAGNGAVWHLRGNFGAYPAAGLPHNAVNLLNPHSVMRDGREVLYNLVDAAAPHPPVPTVVSVRKDPVYGDLLVVCTDGIYSADQLTYGTDAGGTLWVSAEATMATLFHALRDLFAAWDGEGVPPVEAALRECLEGMRARGMLEDDATVGVIVTADALRHQRATRTRAATATAGAEAGSDAAMAGEEHGPEADETRSRGEDEVPAVETAAAGEDGGCTASSASRA
jgi:serine/threonine protein phosphatase PrpC